MLSPSCSFFFKPPYLTARAAWQRSPAVTAGETQEMIAAPMAANQDARGSTSILIRLLYLCILCCTMLYYVMLSIYIYIYNVCLPTILQGLRVKSLTTVLKKMGRFTAKNRPKCVVNQKRAANPSHFTQL